MFKKPSVLYAVIAAAALSAGLLVYLLGRQPEHVYFLFHGFSLAHGHTSPLGVLGNYLPSFVHVYAFILLTATVAGSLNARLLRICTMWFVIACLFECGQHPAVSPTIVAALPIWFARVPVLDNTAAYFLNGTFDLLDLLALAAGTVAAYLTVVLIANRAGTWRSDNPLHRGLRFLAMSGLMLTGMLTIIGSGDDGTAVPGSAAVASHLYVSGNGSNTLLSYNDANSVSGSTAASSTVTGGLTTLNAPRGIAVDMARNQIYVANYAANSILVFNNARTTTGEVVPSRTISNTGTPISPIGLFIDTVNDRLYVTSGNSVLVYDSASTLDGNAITSARTLAGGSSTLSAPTGIFVDTTRNLLYVVNGNSQILVFNSASTVNGSSTAPIRSIPISSGSAGISVDVMADRLYVVSGNSVLVFDDASTANSGSTPDRTLSGGGSMLNQPRDIFVDTGTDRIYVANGDDSILVFNNASTVNGTHAPNRTLNLPPSTDPWGVYVDVTPIVIGSTAGLDGYVLDDSSSVNTDPVGGGPKTGDMEGFLTPRLVARQFYSFELAGIPSTVSVRSATLRLHQANVEGSPYGTGNLGSVIVDHVNYGTSLQSADYNAISLTQNIGTLSADATQAYKTLNVATSVANDILVSRLRSQYRLRFSNENSINAQDDYVQFTDAEDSCCGVNKPPQLLITFSP